MHPLKDFISQHKHRIISFFILYFIFYILQVIFTEKISNYFDVRLAASSLLLVTTSLLLKPTRALMLSSLALFLILGSLIILRLFTNDTLSYLTFNRTFGYIIGITNLTLILAALLHKLKISKSLIPVLILIVLFPVTFIWGYYFTSGAWINIDTILAILQTNVGEAQEYLLQIVTANSLLSTLFFISMAVIISRFFICNLSTVYLTKLSTILLSLCLIGNIVLIYKCRANLLTSVFQEALRYTKTYDEFNKFKNIRKETLELTSDPIEGVYVLVIGESHSRDYSSSYGYKDNTTPWQKKYLRSTILSS